MSKKIIHRLWYVGYAGLIIASSLYWKKQNDLHNMWLSYVEPTNKSVVEFLGSDCDNKRQTIKRQQYDYPGPQADSILTSVDILCQLAKKVFDDCAVISQKIGDKSADTTLLHHLPGHWQAYTAVFSGLQIPDTLLPIEVKNLLTSVSFADWQKAYRSADEKERRYLLNELQRIVYSTLSIALKQQLAVIKLFDYSLKFDGLKMVMNPKHRPIAGQRFEAEIYYSWYSIQNENATATVDGKKCPFKDGIAYFEKVYHTPGMKKIEVFVEVKNPLTGIANAMKREFSIEVVK